MNNQKQIDFLTSLIEESINSFCSRRKTNKNKAFYMQIAVTILASISTIILGLKIDRLEEFTRISALVISTSITIISGVDAFFNHKRLWITYTDALNAMYSLRFDLNYRLLGGLILTDDELENFKKRYQAILDASNEKWMKLRTDDASLKG